MARSPLGRFVLGRDGSWKGDWYQIDPVFPEVAARRGGREAPRNVARRTCRLERDRTLLVEAARHVRAAWSWTPMVVSRASFGPSTRVMVDKDSLAWIQR